MQIQYLLLSLLSAVALASPVEATAAAADAADRWPGLGPKGPKGYGLRGGWGRPGGDRDHDGVPDALEDAFGRKGYGRGGHRWGRGRGRRFGRFGRGRFGRNHRNGGALGFFGLPATGIEGLLKDAGGPGIAGVAGLSGLTSSFSVGEN